MFVEMHMLQNFAPSNLNRDDTNAPKDCEFGGYRRARISSQCLKRAIREEFWGRELLPAENRATRTRRIVRELSERFQQDGRNRLEADQVAIAAVQGLELKFANERDSNEPLHGTQYLLYLAENEIQRFADVCRDHWDELSDLGKTVAPVVEDKETGEMYARFAKAQKPKRELQNALLGSLDGGKAADLAMFGRMIADLPGKRIDAASQVAHAISTNRAAVEFDFYTAVDDFNPQDETGAGMMGTIEFNSACFYRYANVDLTQLQRNLDGDAELARATLDAFLRASISAVPTGKQNSMAAQNPPSFVLVVVRESGLWSMANAFLKPAQPDGTGDLVDVSIQQLDDYWGRLTAMYGNDGIVGAWYVSLGRTKPVSLNGANAGNVSALVDQVLQHAAFDSASAGGAA